MSGVLALLKIHLMIIMWLVCFFALLVTTTATVYLICHYLYLGEKIAFHHFQGVLRHK
jgi:uncharacterized membrane protein